MFYTTNYFINFVFKDFISIFRMFKKFNRQRRIQYSEESFAKGIKPGVSVTQGQVIGTLTISSDGKVLDTVSLLSSETIERNVLKWLFFTVIEFTQSFFKKGFYVDEQLQIHQNYDGRKWYGS